VTLRVSELLGTSGDSAFSSLRHDYVDFPWFDARKSRQRVRSQAGTELELCLEGGTFISDGAVLWADGTTALVARRVPEQCCRITFSRSAEPQLAVRDATILGHALGNQHIPVEFDGNDLLVPVLTSESVLTDTIARLGLTTIEVHFGQERLFAQSPPTKAIAAGP
jgi:urease accessory protein